MSASTRSELSAVCLLSNLMVQALVVSKSSLLSTTIPISLPQTTPLLVPMELWFYLWGQKGSLDPLFLLPLSSFILQQMLMVVYLTTIRTVLILLSSNLKLLHGLTTLWWITLFYILMEQILHIISTVVSISNLTIKMETVKIHISLEQVVETVFFKLPSIQLLSNGVQSTSTMMVESRRSCPVARSIGLINTTVPTRILTQTTLPIWIAQCN